MKTIYSFIFDATGRYKVLWGVLIIMFCLSMVYCYKEVAVPVEAGFDISFVDDDESVPVKIKITNRTKGADTWLWDFEGGTPSSSNDKNPGIITYERPGDYTIKLKASNKDGEKDAYELPLKTYDAIAIDFTAEAVKNNYPPVAVKITNRTEGVGLSYEWTFEGGKPASAAVQQPGTVVFNTPGSYTIALKVSNGFESFTRDTVISVDKDIVVDFDWKVAFDDDDYQAPVTLSMINKSLYAIAWQWDFQGGDPATAVQKEPVVVFNHPGTHTITLHADNGKHGLEKKRQLTILPDTNLRVYTNIKLGINAAHLQDSIGAFFSTATRKVYTNGEVADSIGAKIDIAFLGLDATFSFNKFIAPDEVQDNGFNPIPHARHTSFINSQELCQCGLSFTAAQFDSMTDDTPLKTLTITETPGGLQEFDATMVSRVVLFETADHRKGAIKIKGFIADGNYSYIICDIKIQKQNTNP